MAGALGDDTDQMCAQYNRKDHLYHKAKDEGFKSRAAYKLQELDKKYQLLERGVRVLDLGCWPGGWLQVASSRVGERGVVVGIDLCETDIGNMANCRCLTADIRDEGKIEECRQLAGGDFDVIISDMSPKLSGIAEADRAASVGLAEMARYVCELALADSGNFVVKLFKSNESEQFIRESRPLFNKVVRTELDSTRKSSKEFYMVGLGYRKQ